jgi:hypothetical protein
MPARVFRYTLENTFEGHTLTLESHSLCGGCWTDGWRPPATLASGAKGGWQSESCGIMTGTQGWVKYRINSDSSGASPGLVYIYWTNPYLGVTRWRWDIFGQDTTADCDEDAPGAGSGFAAETGENARPSSLFLDAVEVRRTDDVSGSTNPLVILHAPLVIPLAGGIWERVEIDLRLRSTATPTLLPPPKPSKKMIEVNPEPASFVGRWTGDSISVSLALTGFKRFQVKVSDHTQATPLELDGTATLGLAEVARLVNEHLSNALVLANGSDRADLIKSSVALAAVTVDLSALEARPAGSPPRLLARVRDTPSVLPQALTRTFLQTQAVKAGIQRSPQLSKIVEAIAERSRSAGYAIYIGQGILLYLVRIQEGGDLVDYQLHYQRVADGGAVLADVDLSYVINLH